MEKKNQLEETIIGKIDQANARGEEGIYVALSIPDALRIVAALNCLEEQTKELTEGKAETAVEYNSPYSSTVAGMLSSDYKERFKAEYQQTKIRYEKLKAFNNRIEAARLPMAEKKCEMPKHDCPEYMLREQQMTMGEYLHLLEVRAVLEGIEL